METVPDDLRKKLELLIIIKEMTAKNRIRISYAVILRGPKCNFLPLFKHIFYLLEL